MGDVKIRTNRQWRDFVYRADVPESVLKNQFDWTSEEDGFFRYIGIWYHISEFERLPSCDPTSAFHGWGGYKGDSYFSGILIKLSSDGERFQVGTYTS